MVVNAIDKFLVRRAEVALTQTKEQLAENTSHLSDKERITLRMKMASIKMKKK